MRLVLCDIDSLPVKNPRKKEPQEKKKQDVPHPFAMIMAEIKQQLGEEPKPEPTLLPPKTISEIMFLLVAENLELCESCEDALRETLRDFVVRRCAETVNLKF